MSLVTTTVYSYVVNNFVRKYKIFLFKKPEGFVEKKTILGWLHKQF